MPDHDLSPSHYVQAEALLARMAHPAPSAQAGAAAAQASLAVADAINAQTDAVREQTAELVNLARITAAAALFVNLVGWVEPDHEIKGRTAQRDATLALLWGAI